jgi:hypothetical protein
VNKEKLIQLFSEALDKNVSISLHYSQYQGEDLHPVTNKEAYELVTRYAEALGNYNIHQSVRERIADDYKIDTGSFRVCCSYIPSDEEKINRKSMRIEELKKELAELENDEEVTA